MTQLCYDIYIIAYKAVIQVAGSNTVRVCVCGVWWCYMMAALCHSTITQVRSGQVGTGHWLQLMRLRLSMGTNLQVQVTPLQVPTLANVKPTSLGKIDVGLPYPRVWYPLLGG